MASIEKELEFVRHLCHFFVGLELVSISPIIASSSEPLRLLASGFVVELNRDWYLVSCGHVHNDFAGRMKEFPRYSHQFRILFGKTTIPPNREAVQFQYRTPDFHVNEEVGLDFEATKLTASETSILKEKAVIPVTEACWDQELPPHFTKFGVLGIPMQNMESFHSGWSRFRPSFLPLDPLDLPPQDFAKKTAPMRYFSAMQSGSNDLQMAGMSGGPVFAFSEKDGLKAEFIVCGIQCSWLPIKRILETVNLRFACQQLRKALKSS